MCGAISALNLTEVLCGPHEGCKQQQGEAGPVNGKDGPGEALNHVGDLTVSAYCLCSWLGSPSCGQASTGD